MLIGFIKNWYEIVFLLIASCTRKVMHVIIFTLVVRCDACGHRVVSTYDLYSRGVKDR